MLLKCSIFQFLYEFVILYYFPKFNLFNHPIKHIETITKIEFSAALLHPHNRRIIVVDYAFQEWTLLQRSTDAPAAVYAKKPWNEVKQKKKEDYTR